MDLGWLILGLLIQKESLLDSWTPVFNSESDIVYLGKNHSA